MTVGNEEPIYSKEDQRKKYLKHRPEYPPLKQTLGYNRLLKFSKEIKIILFTINDNEYQAALAFMKPPSRIFNRSVVFPSAGCVVGRFAGHMVALIQTNVGSNSRIYIKDAIDFFQNAEHIYGVGVGYAFDRSKKLGDVLVSNKICDLRSSKMNKEQQFLNRGFTYLVDNQEAEEMHFPVAKDGREAVVHVGTIASFDMLMDNKEFRDKLRRAVPDVIGGEMEGGVLMEFKNVSETIVRAKIIKGIVDYGDGKKEKSWQFTAAMAAFAYTEKLLENPDFR